MASRKSVSLARSAILLISLLLVASATDGKKDKWPGPDHHRCSPTHFRGLCRHRNEWRCDRHCRRESWHHSFGECRQGECFCCRQRW